MILLRNVFFHLLIVATLLSCKDERSATLEIENEKLKSQLKNSEQAVLTIKEISALLDSIDHERKVLRIEMMDGTPYSSYNERMNGVLKYVKISQDKIGQLQQTVQAVNHENSAYTMMLDALKSELQIASTEIQTLQQQVQSTQKKNDQLVTLLHLQQNELDENQVKIETSKQELSLFENKIQQLMIQAKVSEADAFYARAEAVYEAAQRTKLAPRKKKETLKEALELYRKSLSLGKIEAKAKITKLESRL